MRIGFVIQHINAYGGTERAACAVMNDLAQTDEVHLFEVFSRGPARFGLDPRISTTSLFDKHISLLNSWPRLVARMVREIRRHRLDMLVIVESTHALYGVAAAKWAGIPCIVWEHFNFSVDLGKRKRRWGRRLAARWANDIVVLTHRDIELWEAGAAPRANLHCIPNIAPPVSSHTYDPSLKTILALGRFVPQKGFDLLVEAWALVEADPRSEDWRLRIVGDGPDKAGLAARAKRFHRLELAPSESDVEGLFAQTGLMVVPSRVEGLPMVMLEAASFGLPMVAFDCLTGPAEVIEDDESGLLVPPGDVWALVEALLELMSDADRRQKMSERAKEKAVDFSKERVMAAWRALLF
ncbi:glycosyltransferase family 4 protein [Kozakia baliensis]|uniref:glycosyltransferase family 4 protein n=1 Tax=Kozakia baliensis TaxID=153496 RepID=UPI00345B78FC